MWSCGSVCAFNSIAAQDELLQRVFRGGFGETRRFVLVYNMWVLLCTIDTSMYGLLIVTIYMYT